MNTTELVLQGFSIELSKMIIALSEIKEAVQCKSRYDELPEWINIDLAAKLKGGCSLDTVKNKLFLQPCCGTNYKSIGGRKCWRKNDVIAWIDIDDSGLKTYAEKYGVSIPENYERRSA